MKIPLTILALSTATVIAAPATTVRPRGGSVPSQDDPNFVSAVMRAHWYWRRWHCAQDMVWDSSLADAALADVNRCDKEATHYRAGSNLDSMGPAPTKYDDWIEFARTASHGWHDEERLYPYNDPHYENSWGHFTQMVWRDTTRIGCALANCGSGLDFPGRLYCYYENVGNNIAPGQFKTQVWRPVCGNPSADALEKREDPSFDWTRL